MTDQNQEPLEDTLLDRGIEDILDEGYSPPEHQPASHRVGTTAEEERNGETWEQRLAQEEQDPDPDLEHDEQWEIDLSGSERAGRLVAPDEGVREDEETDLYAEDVGIDGGAASAEEAAMHLVEDED
jgi:hypothetical protein